MVKGSGEIARGNYNKPVEHVRWISSGRVTKTGPIHASRKQKRSNSPESNMINVGEMHIGEHRGISPDQAIANLNESQETGQRTRVLRK